MSSTEMSWVALGICSVLSFAVGVAVSRNTNSLKITTKQQSLEDIDIQKDTILRLRNPYTGIACSVQSQLEARTSPNARLQTMFGVNNAFTTRDTKTANAFKAAARTKLRDAVKIGKKMGVDGMPLKEDTDAQWDDVVSSIRRFVQEEVDGTNESKNLAELVQFVTLKVSLMYLFNPGEAALNDREAIEYVAKTINILWIRSKNTNTANVDNSGWNDEQRLHDHLRTITGLIPTEDNANPMNFILPAYETMWRAVLRGLLEVYFRTAPSSPEWQQVLYEFMNNPQREIFRKEDSTTTLCALDIVKEILRVYPPTRRVNRHFPDDPAGLSRSANIEKCHRNALLVPTGDPEVFRPERWLEIKRDFEFARSARLEELRVKKPDAEYKLSDFEEDLGCMPFALLCPAGGKVTQGFGYKMIGLLVIAICEGFDKLSSKEVGSRNMAVSRNDLSGEKSCDLEGSLTAENNHNCDSNLIIEEEIAPEERSEVENTISTEDNINLKTDYVPRLQKWKLQVESPRDELPPSGTALKSERSDYLSLVYRRIV